MKNKLLFIVAVLINGAATMQATRSLPEGNTISSNLVLYFKYPWHYAALRDDPKINETYFNFSKSFVDKIKLKYQMYKFAYHQNFRLNVLDIVRTPDGDTPFHYAALNNKELVVDESINEHTNLTTMGWYLTYLYQKENLLDGFPNSIFIKDYYRSYFLEAIQTEFHHLQNDIKFISLANYFAKDCEINARLERTIGSFSVFFTELLNVSIDKLKLLLKQKEYQVLKELIENIAIAKINGLIRKFPGFDLSFVDAPNRKGYTPLHYAAFMGSNKTIEWLLDLKDKDENYRVNINKKSSFYQYNPLMLAVQRGHDKVIKELFKRNDLQIYVRTFLVYSYKPFSYKGFLCGANVFHFAGQQSNENVLSELLKGTKDKANLSGDNQLLFLLNNNCLKSDRSIEGTHTFKEQEMFSESSPLHIAVANRNLKTVKLLLNQEKIIDLSGRATPEKSPHEMAKKMSGPAAREIEALFWDIKRPFMLAIAKLEVEKVTSMLEYQPGLAFDWINRERQTALDFLKSRGFRVNQEDYVHSRAQSIHNAIIKTQNDFNKNFEQGQKRIARRDIIPAIESLDLNKVTAIICKYPSIITEPLNDKNDFALDILFLIPDVKLDNANHTISFKQIFSVLIEAGCDATKIKTEIKTDIKKESLKEQILNKLNNNPGYFRRLSTLKKCHSELKKEGPKSQEVARVEEPEKKSKIGSKAVEKEAVESAEVKKEPKITDPVAGFGRVPIKDDDKSRAISAIQSLNRSDLLSILMQNEDLLKKPLNDDGDFAFHILFRLPETTVQSNRKKFERMAQFLTMHGAQIMAKNNKGQTAQHLVIMNEELKKEIIDGITNKSFRVDIKKEVESKEAEKEEVKKAVEKALAAGFKVTLFLDGYQITNGRTSIMQEEPAVSFKEKDDIYIIALMPTGDRINSVFDQLLALVKKTDLKKYIYQFSIASHKFYLIFINPILGKDNAQKALDIIYNEFKNEKGLGKPLNYYAKVTDLIYISQGEVVNKFKAKYSDLYEGPENVYYDAKKVKPTDGKTHYLVHPGTKELITGKKVSELSDDKGKADEENHYGFGDVFDITSDFWVRESNKKGFSAVKNKFGYLEVSNNKTTPIMQKKPTFLTIAHFVRDSDNADYHELLRSVYKIKLMPKTNRMNDVFTRLLWVVENTDLKNYIYQFDIYCFYESDVIYSIPRIIIYPILGKGNAQKALNIIYRAFKDEKGLDKAPLFNATVNDFIYVAQGEERDKSLKIYDKFYEGPEKVYYDPEKVKPADGTHYLVHPGTKELITGKKVSELSDDKGKADEE